MKKHIISLLLVVAIILSMTACVAKKSTQEIATQNELETISTQSKTEESEETTEDTNNETRSVEKLSYDSIKEKDFDEFSILFAEMARTAEEEDLSVADMQQMGDNFSRIWYSELWGYIDSQDYDKEEFQRQAVIAFQNVYEQALQKKVPLEKLYSWEEIPVVDILCRYYSSQNFDSPEYVEGNQLYYLTEEEVTEVAQCFFENPVMRINSSIPRVIIQLGFDNPITEQAWDHLEALSQSTSMNYNWVYTYILCTNLLTTIHGVDGEFSNSQYLDKITQLESNILENPSYDLFEKYLIFTIAFEGETHEDKIISGIARDSILELARNADEDTSKQLEELANYIDVDVAEELRAILEAKPKSNT